MIEINHSFSNSDVFSEYEMKSLWMSQRLKNVHKKIAKLSVRWTLHNNSIGAKGLYTNLACG